ncbi:hypothetical protein Riv7116_0827 [Rivularia sp. PCC 7116]|uniref:hypothetical protein n=1 Tax=Rivularia sp. PCC 7116 TaxID=373994 RepID=UPI00029EFE7A|nr:hypothetical protein [Rivularia sp. PCC 7116]AFY53411.1 hypothetical protein Riv7116_0827 [Rivularia sp. PCC 7116]
MINQIAFVILFLYVRSSEFSKYPKFDYGKRESKPDDELNIDKVNRKQQESFLEKQHQVEAKYFLERRTFL